MKVKARNETDTKLVSEADRIARQYKRVRPDGPTATRLGRRYQGIVARLGYDPIS